MPCQHLPAISFLSPLPAWGATTAVIAASRGPGISIHAPRVGSDPELHSQKMQPENFYPRSPRGERRWTRHCECQRCSRFLSTLPAWGATPMLSNLLSMQLDFYPRSPRGERRFLLSNRRHPHHISIHAPRVGSDLGSEVVGLRMSNFYPRSPRGERPNQGA